MEFCLVIVARSSLLVKRGVVRDKDTPMETLYKFHEIVACSRGVIPVQFHVDCTLRGEEAEE